ncbi:helix-turn-helix transcriptional regulator [Acetonema longum]|uniref:XRE family transcriptional regulator n=1 Tax=Acetonema longum DSM 6540 TaxID=1009370 RepID=F7NE07_9FIRM|nr:helix-turn-helix domain-containing protein [Acetonema longum]EGO65662.1 XRE family transcriptional regulator [Acetonema longum DSM 6540]
MEETIAERLKYLRIRYKLTQKQFAEVLELSQGNVSEMERGKFNPSLDTVLSACSYFKISADWILFGIGAGPGEQNSQEEHAKFIAENSTEYPSQQTTEAVFDPDLKEMIDLIRRVMDTNDQEQRIWAKFQLKRAFADFCTVGVNETSSMPSTDAGNIGKIVKG